MSHTDEHMSQDWVMHFCAKSCLLCFIAAFISALYYSFEVTAADGVLYDPVYLWNFSCVAIVIACTFGFYALWRKSN